MSIENNGRKGVIAKYTPEQRQAWEEARQALRKCILEIHPMLRKNFAEKVGTSRAQLSQIISGIRPCSVDYAVRIDKLSGGAVPMTGLSPHIDWDYIRSAMRKRGDTRRTVRGDGNESA